MTVWFRRHTPWAPIRPAMTWSYSDSWRSAALAPNARVRAQPRTPLEIFVVVSQLVIAASVFFVWTQRLANIKGEFREYALPDPIRNAVGATKMAAAALLVAGIWYPALVVPSAVVMASFMLSAQYFHFRVRHPAVKYLASFALLMLSVFVAVSAYSRVG
jgi:hypothetical protein